MATHVAREHVWTLDPAHSSIELTARHLVIHPVRGTFKRWTAHLEIDEHALERSFVRVAIEVASIDTGNVERDDHLQALFESKRFPMATFESKRIERTEAGLRVIGDFELHGVTREIAIDVEVSHTDRRISFVGKTAIGRKHHGVVWSPAIELSSGVSDRVAIDIRLDAITAPEHPSPH